MTVKPPLTPHPPDVDHPIEQAAAAELLAEAQLKERELAAVELDGAAVPGLRLMDVVVRGGAWPNLQAREATLERVETTGLDAIGIQLPEASLSDCTFLDCRLDLASFRFAKLERVVFERCRLDEADFYEASLRSVRLDACTLTGATFAGATFDRCELRGCELTDLAGVERLRGVRMPWPDVVQIAGLLAAAAGIEIVD